MLSRIINLLLSIPLWVLYFISGLLPRKMDLRVYGSPGGRFSDNAMYAFIDDHYKNKEVCWISNRKSLVQDLIKNGYNSEYKWSLKGIITCLLASEYHFSSYVSDINVWTSKGAKRINYWHGCPFKKIEYDIDSGFLRKYYNPSGFQEYISYVGASIRYPAIRLRPNKIYSPYPFFDKYLVSAFRISENELIRKPLPRVSYAKGVLSDVGQKYNVLFDNFPLRHLNKRMALYAPTFRDGDSEWFNDSFFPSMQELQSLLQSLDILLIIKLHPNENFSEGYLSDNIFILDSGFDIHLLFPRINFLITDYSSISIDAAVLGIPVYLVWPDMDSYSSLSRDFYFDMNIFFGGRSHMCLVDLFTDIENKESSTLNVGPTILANIGEEEW